MHILSIHEERSFFRFVCSVIFIIALARSAGAADETRLEPTAHQNVKRTYSPAAAAVSTSETQTTTGGMVVYLDGQGRLTQTPGRARESVRLPEMNQSHEGLVARRVHRSGGLDVTTVDLQGRFQSFATGTIGPDGKVSTGCITPGDVKPHDKDTGTSGCQGKCCN